MAIAEAELEAPIMPGMEITEDELMRLPDDGYCYERVDGVVARKPWASFLAGAIAANIVMLLGPHTRGKGVMSIGKAGFRMANGNIRVPSASFTRKERLPGGHAPNSFGDLAPDLCIEIIPPSERKADMARKVREYFHTGAQIVWHVFPERQQVVVFTSPTETRTFASEDMLDAGDVLPGFFCRVAELFVRE